MGFFDGAGGGLLSGGLQIASNFLGGESQRRAADHAMDRSDAAAREQMAFQERMSNSAYQRSTEDLKKAGLNPMLAYMNGGASTPAGASATAPMANTTNPMGGVISSAIDALRLNNELKKGDSDRVLNDALSTKALADSAAAGASTKQMTANTKAVESQLDAIAKEAKVRSQKAGYDQKAGAYDAVMSRLNRDSNSASQLLNLFNPAKGWKGPKGSTLMNDKTGEVLKEFP